MSKLLLNLRMVLEDEADDVRAMLEAHRIEFYETRPSRWGVSHGGIWVIPLVSNPILYLLAIVIGTVITAGLVIVLMSLDAKKTEELAHAEDVAEGVSA